MLKYPMARQSSGPRTQVCPLVHTITWDSLTETRRDVLAGYGSNEPGPDFADYPMDTVPNKVHQLFSAQLFHDRRQREVRHTVLAKDASGSTACESHRDAALQSTRGLGG